jgi:hypothetical protein
MQRYTSGRDWLKGELPGFGQSTDPGDLEWSVANFAVVTASFLGQGGGHIRAHHRGQDRRAITVQFSATNLQRTI